MLISLLLPSRFSYISSSITLLHLYHLRLGLLTIVIDRAFLSDIVDLTPLLHCHLSKDFSHPLIHSFGYCRFYYPLDRVLPQDLTRTLRIVYVSAVAVLVFSSPNCFSVYQWVH